MSFDKVKKEEKNILLANTIKNYEVLYDQHNPFYTNRLEQDKAWQEVAKEMDETVMNCKENWRSLRNSFVRDLRLPPLSNTNALRKSYYMSEHLQFLVPFLPTKQRQNHAARTFGTPYGSEDGHERRDEKVNVSDNHDSTDEDMEAAESDRSNVNLEDSFDGYDNSPDRRKRSKTNSHNYLRPRINPNYSMENNPDFDFLRSLLPDVTKLPDRSKMTFKLRTLELLNHLLYSEDPLATIPSATVNEVFIKKEELNS